MFFYSQSGRVLVTGKTDGLIQISGRIHNADDIVATVLAIEPIRFVYRGRLVLNMLCIFSILQQHLITFWLNSSYKVSFYPERIELWLIVYQKHIVQIHCNSNVENLC